MKIRQAAVAALLALPAVFFLGATLFSRGVPAEIGEKDAVQIFVPAVGRGWNQRNLDLFAFHEFVEEFESAMRRPPIVSLNDSHAVVTFYGDPDRFLPVVLPIVKARAASAVHSPWELPEGAFVLRLSHGQATCVFSSSSKQQKAACSSENPKPYR